MWTGNEVVSLNILTLGRTLQLTKQQKSFSDRQELFWSYLAVKVAQQKKKKTLAINNNEKKRDKPLRNK